jgi:hypothetical protein
MEEAGYILVVLQISEVMNHNDLHDHHGNCLTLQNPSFLEGTDVQQMLGNLAQLIAGNPERLESLGAQDDQWALKKGSHVTQGNHGGPCSPVSQSGREQTHGIRISQTCILLVLHDRTQDDRGPHHIYDPCQVAVSTLICNLEAAGENFQNPLTRKLVPL